jgi:hypothetical protein
MQAHDEAEKLAKTLFILTMLGTVAYAAAAFLLVR